MFDSVSVRNVVSGIVFGVLVVLVGATVVVNRQKITTIAEQPPSPLRIQVSPSSITGNIFESSTFSVTVTNPEEEAVKPFLWLYSEGHFLLPDRRDVYPTDLPILGPGQSHSFQQEFKCIVRGNDQLGINYHDLHPRGDGTFAFPHRTNNYARFPVRCVGADLVSEILPFTAQARVGETVSYRVATKNIGDSSSRPSVTGVYLPLLHVPEGQNSALYFNVGALAPNGSQTDNFTVTCRGPTFGQVVGSEAITSEANVVGLDPDNRTVPESDRTNNTSRASLQCVGPLSTTPLPSINTQSTTPDL